MSESSILLNCLECRRFNIVKTLNSNSFDCHVCKQEMLKSVDYQSANIIAFKCLQERIQQLEQALRDADENFCHINNIAPPMYKYNNIEFEIITTARQAREKIEKVLSD